MPYLNWKERTELAQTLAEPAQPDEHPHAPGVLSLSLGPSHLAELLPLLAEIFAPEAASELRLDLPGNWILFWKRREGDSRLLLAHPQAEEWVATVAFCEQDGALLVRRLGELSAGEALSLRELGHIGYPSNLELRLKRV